MTSIERGDRNNRSVGSLPSEHEDEESNKNRPSKKRGLAHAYDDLDPEDYKNVGRVRGGKSKPRSKD